jgi:tRNA pseudouridine38-40 synthase
MRLKATISYDGKNFSGFAKQPNKRTVEEELSMKFSIIYNQKIKIIKSSRTDSGVHALKYDLAFDVENDIPLNNVKSFINTQFEDIKIISIEKVEDNFNPRYDAKSRTYLYKIFEGDVNEGFILRDYHLNHGKKIDIKKIKKISKMFVGTKDFASFTAREKYTNTVRTINYIKIKRKAQYLYIEINGDGFLR